MIVILYVIVLILSCYVFYGVGYLSNLKENNMKTELKIKVEQPKKLKEVPLHEAIMGLEKGEWNEFYSLKDDGGIFAEYESLEDFSTVYVSELERNKWAIKDTSTTYEEAIKALVNEGKHIRVNVESTDEIIEANYGDIEDLVNLTREEIKKGTWTIID